MSHREIYDAVWSGPGPAGSTGPETLWASAESNLSDVADILNEAARNARGSWFGMAAENAIDSIISLATWAGGASADAARLRGAVVAQGEYIAYTRNTIPPPPPEEVGPIPPAAGFAPIVGIPVLLDWQAKEAEQNELAQQAVHVMETYENNTAQNKPHIQAFASPAAVTAGGTGLDAISGVIGRAVGRVGATAAAALSVAAGLGGAAGAGLPIGLGAAAGAAGVAGAASAGVIGTAGAAGAAGAAAGGAAGAAVGGAAGAAAGGAAGVPGAAGLPVAVGGGVIPPSS